MDIEEVRILIDSNCHAHFPDTKKRWKINSISFLERDVEGPLSPKTEWLAISLIPCGSQKKLSKHAVSRRITLYADEIIVAFGTKISSRVNATDQAGKKQELFFLKDDSGRVREIHVTQ